MTTGNLDGRGRLRATFFVAHRGFLLKLRGQARRQHGMRAPRSPSTATRAESPVAPQTTSRATRKAGASASLLKVRLVRDSGCMFGVSPSRLMCALYDYLQGSRGVHTPSCRWRASRKKLRARYSTQWGTVRRGIVPHGNRREQVRASHNLRCAVEQAANTLHSADYGGNSTRPYCDPEPFDRAASMRSRQ
jgi:hypothetical protein